MASAEEVKPLLVVASGNDAGRSGRRKNNKVRNVTSLVNLESRVSFFLMI